MGNGASRVAGCFVPARGSSQGRDRDGAVLFSGCLDEGLGHSFCYVRPSESPPPGAVLLTPCQSGRYDDLRGNGGPSSSSFFEGGGGGSGGEEFKLFRAISGTSVSANTFTPRTIAATEQFGAAAFLNSTLDRAAAFDSTPSFAAIPLQRVPRSLGLSHSGPLTLGATAPFSSSYDKGFLSGPLERNGGSMSGPIDPTSDRIHFSAPLTGTTYVAAALRRRRRALRHLARTVGNPVRKALSRTLSRTSLTLSRTHRSLVTPVKHLASRPVVQPATARSDNPKPHMDCPPPPIATDTASGLQSNGNLHWYQGMAGEDRVHVVLSEEHEWLFVGIYDGFNGPDATDFLMSNLYQSIFKELRGLLWDTEEGGGMMEQLQNLNGNGGHQEASKKTDSPYQVEGKSRNSNLTDAVSTGLDGKARARNDSSSSSSSCYQEECCLAGEVESPRETLRGEASNTSPCQFDTPNGNKTKSNETHRAHSKPLDHRSVRNWKVWGGKHLFRSRQVRAFGEKKENHRKMSPLQCVLEQQGKKGVERRQEEKVDKYRELKRVDPPPADPQAVLKALADALDATEEAYLEMADQALEENPELALMGSCVLVMLMKGEDVYVMNIGDSRAVLAQESNETWNPVGPSNEVDETNKIGVKDSVKRSELERIAEETPTELEDLQSGPTPMSITLNALQLSTDHSTSIEDEVLRIQAEHPDDSLPIFNDRVKGRLKVTRAFGAGFLKKPKWNCALLEMFRVDYMGTSPYISCTPALCHHRVGPRDRFLVLSSDGLYQFLSNEEVISHVEWFVENFPEGDPAQHLAEQLLFRAAKKAGMDFHDLLEIPQGDRRKYHDDISVLVVSLNGKIWRYSG